MHIIKPIEITPAMVAAGTTIAEPSANETAWSGSAVVYAVGDIRIRSTTHRRYKCAVAHTSAAAPLPEDDPTRWVDVGPTDRFAPFDSYTSTAATALTSLTYVLTPGFFNSIALYGLTGGTYSVTVKDAPGGSVIFSNSGFLYEDPEGWYEYLFTAPKLRRKLFYFDLPIRPTAELTITLTADAGQPVGIGMIVVGDYVPLFGWGLWGGTEYGSSVEPVTYSFIKTEDDGTTTIRRRHSATNLRVKVVMPQDQADYAVAQLQDVLDIPVAWIATDQVNYQGLTTFGLGSATVIYSSFGHANIEIFVKGLT